MQALGRIAPAVQEGVTVLLNEDGMLANADRYGEFTVLVRDHLVAPFVFHHRVINTETAALHRIGGMLIIHHALHIEAAVILKVLRVEAQRLRRHIQRACGWFEIVCTLRRYQRVGRALIGKRNAA